MGIIHTAMATQHKLTYGLSLSPTLAHFQNIPKKLYGPRISDGSDVEMQMRTGLRVGDEVA
jgi:hypothetical protein